MKNLRRLIRKELLKEQVSGGFVTVSSDRKTADVKCPEGMGVVKIDNNAIPYDGNTWAGGFGGSVQIYCGPVGNEAGDTKTGESGEPIEGCMDPTAFNYDPNATFDDGSCIPKIFGCNDPIALNYHPMANTNDGNCIYEYTDPRSGA